MKRSEQLYLYQNPQRRQAQRRERIQSLLLLLLVLGLGAVCAVAYYHARGGFAR